MENNNDVRFLHITGTEVSKEDRLIEDHEKLLWVIGVLKKEGLKIVYTTGTYDMFHVGHARYLQKAKECGGILIVGLDSDELTKKRKGTGRPIVPYNERSETLVHNRSVNIVTILRNEEEPLLLLEKMQPDVIVLSFSSTKESPEDFKKRMHEKYKSYCKEIIIFDKQATTSTSARLRDVVMTGSEDLLKCIESVDNLLKQARDSFYKNNGGE